jgi:hypothetical protein
MYFVFELCDTTSHEAHLHVCKLREEAEKEYAEAKKWSAEAVMIKGEVMKRYDAEEEED